MKIVFHKRFVKSFKKRIKNNPQLVNKFKQRYQLFLNDKNNPILRNHHLSGDLIGKSAFSINSDIRVIYEEKNDVIIFLDIGTHNQVYK
ncbi:MAG: type II toxin-antitoxin system YafQ family toxin [Microgenomates group bacterium]